MNTMRGSHARHNVHANVPKMAAMPHVTSMEARMAQNMPAYRRLPLW